MFNFKSITLGDSRYNFHSHTQFCDGRATMAEFAEAVSKAGFRHWGFSPHSPVPIDSPCNMAEYDVPIYLAEVCRLNSLYESSDIEFYTSMEIDYLGEHWGPANDYFQQLPLDYRIGSVHFIPAPDTGEPVDIDGRYESFLRKMHDYFHDDIHYVVNTFFDQSLAMVRAGGFDLIGHFDKIGHNASHFCPGIEDEPFYRRRLLELTDAIIASGVTVEINTKALAEHGRLFPSSSVWPILLKAGVPVVVNSDAHYTHLVNASRPEALAMLEKTAAEISTPTL